VNDELRVMNLVHLRPPKVLCAGCKQTMTEKNSKSADVIQLATRTKWVIYICSQCGGEVERLVQVALQKAKR
jgi:hypothetical protein